MYPLTTCLDCIVICLLSDRYYSGWTACSRSSTATRMASGEPSWRASARVCATRGPPFASGPSLAWLVETTAAPCAAWPTSHNAAPATRATSCTVDAASRRTWTLSAASSSSASRRIWTSRTWSSSTCCRRWTRGCTSTRPSSATRCAWRPSSTRGGASACRWRSRATRIAWITYTWS